MEGNKVLVGSDKGVLEYLSMHFTAVHALDSDRYAYRENLTEVKPTDLL